MTAAKRGGLSVAGAGTTVLIVAACTGAGDSTNPHHATGGRAASFNAANTRVVNPSTHVGGTVKYALAGKPDSFDPGNTYTVFNVGRIWARTLTAFRSVPGPAALGLVPDLATGLGKPSDGGRTYTYTIRSGLTFSDGSPITTKDIKYAIERSNYAPEVLSNGPTYFSDVLVDNDPPYRGPYQDPAGDLKSIQTPDDTTIVFHLNAPFADFDYLTSELVTAPVPRAKDTGAGYVTRIVSSGSYMFKSFDWTSGAVLVRNPHWEVKNDPLRKQYPDKIEILFDREQTGIDQDLLAGNLTGDLSPQGVATSTQGAILSNPARKANADVVQTDGLIYLAMSTRVLPLDNLDCRKAVEYAVDKVSVLNSSGGPLHGAIASTMLPPGVAGHRNEDPYPTPRHLGSTAKAKAFLNACGRPNGFSVGLAARGDQPIEMAGAVSIQASLRKVGIDAHIEKFPSGKYFSNYAGAPAFVHSHDLGLMMMGWEPDWPDGYGYFDQMVAGRNIKPSGNGNLSELDDPVVNTTLAEAIRNPDVQERTASWTRVDRRVMADAALVPLIYAKVLMYRPPAATNIFVSAALGGYDFLNVGVK